MLEKNTATNKLAFHAINEEIHNQICAKKDANQPTWNALRIFA